MSPAMQAEAARNYPPGSLQAAPDHPSARRQLLLSIDQTYGWLTELPMFAS